MHGLKPEDIQHLAHLRGRKLTLVSLGEYDLQFHFSPQASVSVEGRCEMLDTSGEVLDVWNRGTRSAVLRFLDLLGGTVTEVVIDSPRSFKLTFDSTRQLRLVDNSDQYESFSVGGMFV
jgi:hypothetical protein